MVQLGDLGNRRPAQLSGGQQQRVALARALVFEPKLVLMDEPLGALDKQLREHMQLEIKHLHEQLGVTVVYVTHDQSEALTMSDRVAVFNDGADPAAGTARELYERPQQRLRRRVHRREQPAARRGRARWTAALPTSRLEGGAAVRALRGQCRRRRRAARRCRCGPSGWHSTAPDGMQPNRLPGRVIEELIYHGDHIRVRVTVCRATTISWSRCRNRAGQPALAAGDAVTVGWLAEDCRALDRLRG